MLRAPLLLSLLFLSNCTTTPRPVPAFEVVERVSEDGVRLRVLTYNIQWALRGLEPVAQVIRAVKPDVVALQEVDSGTTRSNGLDQAEELARLTGLPYHHHFSATEMHGGHYGVAILSRLPLSKAERFPLPNWALTEPRVLGRAEIATEEGPIAVYVTHLSHLPTHGALRRTQAERILEIASTDPRPKLLLGDFNEGPGGGVVTSFAERLTNVFAVRGEGPAYTYPLPLFLPNQVLDYVFASAELSPMRAQVVPNQASDHYALFAEVELATVRAEPGRSAPEAPELATSPARTATRTSPLHGTAGTGLAR